MNYKNKTKLELLEMISDLEQENADLEDNQVDFDKLESITDDLDAIQCRIINL